MKRLGTHVLAGAAAAMGAAFAGFAGGPGRTDEQAARHREKRPDRYGMRIEVQSFDWRKAKGLGPRPAWTYRAARRNKIHGRVVASK